MLRPGDTLGPAPGRGIAGGVGAGRHLSGRPRDRGGRRLSADTRLHAGRDTRRCPTTNRTTSAASASSSASEASDFADLGDLTWNVEHKLVCPRNLLGPVDVYQVTHHGLDNSNHPALIAAAAPSLAVVNNGPRKGGKAEVYARLRRAPGPPDILQVHRNVETGPGDNAPSAAIANEEEACRGRWTHLSVDPRARKLHRRSSRGKALPACTPSGRKRQWYDHGPTKTSDFGAARAGPRRSGTAREAASSRFP